MNQGAIIWLAGAIVGFIIWWPIGVAVLATIFATAVSQQLTGYAAANVTRNLRMPRFVSGSSGNTAFDEHREQVLRRLEEDQHAFVGFMDRLRRAKDREEFDRFMAERK